MEYRRICNVCGKIYCYTDKDLKDNATNSALSALSAIGGLASVFGGTRIDTYALSNQSDRYSEKIVNYDKCPSCNSLDTKIISDEEWVDLQKNGKIQGQSQVVQSKAININSNASEESLLKRIKLFLEESDWESASVYCENVLDIDPECAQVYVYKLMIEYHVSKQEDLVLLSEPFYDSKNYINALRFADDSLKKVLEGYNNRIKELKYENAYNSAMNAFNLARTEQDYRLIIPKFLDLGDYKNSAQMVYECDGKANLCKYNNAVQLFDNAKSETDYLDAKKEFDSLGNYSDAMKLAATCNDKIISVQKDAIYFQAVSEENSNTLSGQKKAILEYERIPGWRDSDQRRIFLINRINEKNEAQERTKKKRKKIIIISLISIIVCIVGVIASIYIFRYSKYNSAMKKYAEGDYIEAIEIWYELDNYLDASDKVFESIERVYDEAKNYASKEDYSMAIALLDKIKPYSYEFSSSEQYDKNLKLRKFCECVQELQVLDDGEIHNLTDIYQSITSFSSEIECDEIIDNNIITELLSLNGTWKRNKTINAANNKKVLLLTNYYVISDGKVDEYDEFQEFKYSWNIYYRSGIFYLTHPGTTKSPTGHLNNEISDYDGAGDDDFTYHTQGSYDGEEIFCEIEYLRQ